MSDEYGDYAGDEQDTIRAMLRYCFNCDDEWCDEDVVCPPEWRIEDRKSCRDQGHEPLLTEHDLEWVVCGTCDGSGKSSRYLGAYTQSEWAEQDDEFKDDYLSGRYDRPCPECGGRTTVRAIREDARHSDEIDAWFKDMHDMRSIERAERAMGA